MAKIEEKYPPLVVIVGQTASGKTALGIDLAERFGGEIICADSRTIYKGMDIGTAKPTVKERTKIPHHCLDIIEPNQTFSAAEFKRLALAAIKDITVRGKLPIIVGGTGLYIDAVLFDFKFGSSADVVMRNELSTKTVPELQAIINSHGYNMPENSKNKRYLIRTIERKGVEGNRSPLRPNTLVLGLKVDPATLKQRIATRVDTMVEAGFVQEYRALRRKFPKDAPAFLAPGYKAFDDYINGSVSLAEAKAAFMQNDVRLAKRQWTWFKRNECVQWLDDRSNAVDIVTTFLNK